jgi:hypothetical protein
MTYRELSAQALAETDYNSFLEELECSLTDGRRDPNVVVQETLAQIYYGNAVTNTENLSSGARAVIHTFDPRNVTTEPEYYSDIDADRYAVRKPFIWLWQMFDRSPLGQNALLGRRMVFRVQPDYWRQCGRSPTCPAG